MECLIYIRYSLRIRKWQARSEEEKTIVREDKRRTNFLFKERVGILIDVPKHGPGSSNNGNTARRFFQDPEAASEITDQP